MKQESIPVGTVYLPTVLRDGGRGAGAGKGMPLRAKTKGHSHRTKLEAKANIFFDVCRLFFYPLIIQEVSSCTEDHG